MKKGTSNTTMSLPKNDACIMSGRDMINGERKTETFINEIKSILDQMNI